MVEPSGVDNESSGSRQYSLRALLIGVSMVCIVLGMLRAAPYSSLLLAALAVALTLDRLEARWKAEGIAVKPLWYRLGRRLYFGLSGLVHAAIVGVLIAVAVHNLFAMDVDLAQAAIFAGALGATTGAAYPDFIKSVSILF